MSNEIRDRFISPKNYSSNILIIGDVNWWVENETEIHKWLDKTFPEGKKLHQGMVLHFDTIEQKTWFLLRWAS